MVAPLVVAAAASALKGIASAVGANSDRRATNKQRKKQHKRDVRQTKRLHAVGVEDGRLQYQRLVEAAELAGFNPLTALRGGSGVLPGSAVVQSLAPPPLSSGATIADAFGGMVDAVADYDPLQAERDQLEVQLLKQELETAKSVPKLAMAGRQGVGSNPVAMTGGPRQPVDLSGGYPLGPETGLPTQIMASDGLPMANPEQPVELETDAWAAARAGTLWGFTKEVIGRNLPDSLARRSNMTIVERYKDDFADMQPGDGINPVVRSMAEGWYDRLKTDPARAASGAEAFGQKMLDAPFRRDNLYGGYPTWTGWSR